MKHYWCFLCIRYKTPRLIRIGDRNEAMRAEGYWIRIGISVQSGSELRRAVKDYMGDGRIAWKQSELERIQRYDLSQSAGRGVWYRGGPFYFTQ